MNNKRRTTNVEKCMYVCIVTEIDEDGSKGLFFILLSSNDLQIQIDKIGIILLYSVFLLQ